MTVGMLLATILLVLTFSGVLCGAWERLGIRQRTAGAWLLAMLAALLMPDVRLGAARVNPAGLAVGICLLGSHADLLRDAQKYAIITKNKIG